MVYGSHGEVIASPALYIPWRIPFLKTKSLHILKTYSLIRGVFYLNQETVLGPVAPIKFTKKTLEPYVIDELTFEFKRVEPISYIHLNAKISHDWPHILQWRCLLMLIRYFMDEVRFQMAALAASEDRETRQKVEELKRYIPQPPDWVEVLPIFTQCMILVDPASFEPELQLLRNYSCPAWCCLLVDFVRDHGMNTHKAFLNYAGLNQPTTDRECLKKINEHFNRIRPAILLTLFKCFNSLDEFERFIIEKHGEISKFRNRLSKLEKPTIHDLLNYAVEYGVVTADELDDHDSRLFNLFKWALEREWPLKGFKERVCEMRKLFDKWDKGDPLSFDRLALLVFDFSDGSKFDRYVWAPYPGLAGYSLGLYVSRAVADQVLRGLKPTCPFQNVNCPQFEEFWHCKPGYSGICLPECPVKSFENVETNYSDKERRDWLKLLNGRMEFLMKES